MNFGLHVRTGAGYDEAVTYAQRLGCTSLQFFSSSPRTYRVGKIDPPSLERITGVPVEQLTAAARLVPGWHPVDQFSGMQHHMVFDRTVLAELMRRVEDAHDTPFWRAFLNTIESSKWTGASEYVLYRHFACWLFPERVAVRHLSTAEVIE